MGRATVRRFRGEKAAAHRILGVTTKFLQHLARATVPKLALAPSMIEAFAASEQVESVLGNVERERKVDVAPKGLRTLKLCPSIPYPERQVLEMRPAVSAAAVREDALPRGGNAHSQTSLPWATSGSPGSHLAQVTRFCGIFDLWLSFPVATSHRRTVLSREPLNSCSCVKSWTSLNVFQEHGVSENAPCAFPRHVPSRRANGGICTRLLLIDRDGLDCKLVSAEPLQRPRLSWSPLADSRVPGSAERVPLSP